MKLVTVLPTIERRFGEEYFAGEYAGIATRAYLQANPEVSYDRASVEGSALLRTRRIQQFLRELHQQITEATAAKLEPWSELLGMAQSIIVATAQGRMRNRLAYEAAKYLVERCLGTPTSNTDVTVRKGEAGTIAALHKVRRKSRTRETPTTREQRERFNFRMSCPLLVLDGYLDSTAHSTYVPFQPDYGEACWT